MTLNQAEQELERIASRTGGTISKTGRFLDTPADLNVVGYGIVPGRKGSWIIVSVPR